MLLICKNMIRCPDCGGQLELCCFQEPYIHGRCLGCDRSAAYHSDELGDVQRDYAFGFLRDKYSEAGGVPAYPQGW